MKWDEETEVLIIGFGGAGAVAAMTAHDSGAKVLVVEKMEKGGRKHEYLHERIP